MQNSLALIGNSIEKTTAAKSRQLFTTSQLHFSTQHFHGIVYRSFAANLSSPVCSLLLLCLLAIHDSRQQPPRPPRGYCAPISRAIPSESRCFEHLVLWPPTGHAHPQNNPTKKSDDNDAAADEEELVYVRLETSGPSLDNLTTRAINERLLGGVFAQLFSLTDDADADADRSHQSGAASSRRRQYVRAQILAADEDGGVASKCRQSMERLVCRLVYPTCHFRRADVSALVRPPCREDCFLLRDLFCANLNWDQFVAELRRALNSTLMAAIRWPVQLEPSAAPSAPSRSKRSSLATSPARGRQSDVDDNDVEEGASKSVRVPPIHFYWPHENSLESCERLPPLRPILSRRPQRMKDLGDGSSQISSNRVVSSARRRRRRHSSARVWPVCSNAHLTAAPAPRAPTRARPSPSGRGTINGTTNGLLSCLSSPNGIDYRGQANRTSDGLECQAWTSQKPHRHTSSELLFDNMREAKNYCRNPGGLELKPWCYTQDPDVRWQYCDLSPCA